MGSGFARAHLAVVVSYFIVFGFGVWRLRGVFYGGGFGMRRLWFVVGGFGRRGVVLWVVGLLLLVVGFLFVSAEAFAEFTRPYVTQIRGTPAGLFVSPLGGDRG